MDGTLRILVICTEPIDAYPPTIALCKDLLGLGHFVTLMASACHRLPNPLLDDNRFTVVNLADRPSGIKRVMNDLQTESFVRSYIRRNKARFDLIWTCTDYSARAGGKELFGCKHVMQLMELAEYVPIATRHDLRIKSKVVVELARRAHHVVVPEENRSFIQQAWWQIPMRPIVLPNKSVVEVDDEARSQYRSIDELFKRDARKKLLYQGVFSPDRDFSGLIAAMDELKDGYALYLMGVHDADRARLEGIVNGRDNVVLVPFVPAPYHLLFTSYAHIGLLPYKPSYTRQSPLNALFCAPNKIWEYSRFGLPMLGSCVPGLNSVFDKYGIGLTTDIDNPTAIANAVLDIELRWDEMSEKSGAFYQSVDTRAIIERILG